MTKIRRDAQHAAVAILRNRPMPGTPLEARIQALEVAAELSDLTTPKLSSGELLALIASAQEIVELERSLAHGGNPT